MQSRVDQGSRYARGAFEERFCVTRLDGKATRPEARYFVLDYSGADPHAAAALKAYAVAVRDENPGLADSVLNALDDPHNSPAQHPCANTKGLQRSELVS